MPQSRETSSPPVSGPHAQAARTILLEVLVVLVVSLLLGGLTSPAQTFLPGPLKSFANSASGWTLLTALTVWATRERRVLAAAILGAGSFVALLVGYQVVSTLRGFPDSGGLFLALAVLAGPIVGIAAAWLHRRDLAAALGAAALAGIGLGDAAYGLLRISSTTGWFYWALIAALALTLVAVVTTRRLVDIRDRAVTIAGAVLVAAAFSLAYSSLG